MSNLPTLKIYEKVKFPELSDEYVLAKIDTGADSGALHASNIKIINRHGKYHLSFKPFNSKKTIWNDNFSVKYVKSSNGEKQQRFFINTFVRIKGSKRKIKISLTDRSSMNYEVIIGRKFLRGKFLVDPSD